MHKMNFTERIVNSVVKGVLELSAKDKTFLQGVEDKINKTFEEQKKLVDGFIEMLKKAVVESGFFLNQTIWNKNSFDIDTKDGRHYARIHFNDLTYWYERIDTLLKDVEKNDKHDELEYLALKIKKEVKRIFVECKKNNDEVIKFLEGFFERSGFGDKNDVKIRVTDGESKILDNSVIYVYLEFYFKQKGFTTDPYKIYLVNKNKCNLVKQVEERFSTVLIDFEEEKSQADSSGTYFKD